MKNSSKYEEEEACQMAAAFEEGTRSTTWPPRSYTCSFCRREFRSAQALGGHMNVHRRDRVAKLHHQTQTQTLVHYHQTASELGSTSYGDPFLNWANNVGFGSVVGNNNDLSLFYQLGINNYNHEFVTNFGLMSSNFLDNNYGMQVSEVLPDEVDIISKTNEVEEPIEELDLELRLGHLHAKIR